MHHEHTGSCCHSIEPPHEHHEYHHAALGHICTGACLHEAAEAHALAALQADRATIERFQTRRQVTEDKELDTKDKRKKSKRPQRLGTFGLATLTQAA
ncbi:MAG TPA: hypothetical protein VGM08_04230 [Candidatus Saccharimonadales bacterium]|jgi:hypothetical protein